MEIALALGGGGARGIAHLGVVAALQSRGFEVGAMAGTSIGGLIGALLACGYQPEDLRARLGRLDQRRLFGQRPGDMPSLLGLAGLTDTLLELVGEMRFEDLAIPFAVTAVDIQSNQPVTLCHGRLVDAVLATIAIPGIFPPRRTPKNQLLVDGGMINPVPVDIARSLAPRLPVIGVPLTGVPVIDKHDVGKGLALPVPGIDYIRHLRVGQALQTFLVSWETSTRLLTELRLSLDHPEALVRPAVDDIQVLGVVDVADVYQRGEEAVQAAESELKQLTAWPGRITRWLKGNLPENLRN